MHHLLLLLLLLMLLLLLLLLLLQLLLLLISSHGGRVVESVAVAAPADRDSSLTRHCCEIKGVDWCGHKKQRRLSEK